MNLKPLHSLALPTSVPGLYVYHNIATGDSFIMHERGWLGAQSLVAMWHIDRDPIFSLSFEISSNQTHIKTLLSFQ